MWFMFLVAIFCVNLYALFAHKVNTKVLKSQTKKTKQTPYFHKMSVCFVMSYVLSVFTLVIRRVYSAAFSAGASVAGASATGSAAGSSFSAALGASTAFATSFFFVERRLRRVVLAFAAFVSLSIASL